jgi:hypothetical protein
LEAQEAAEKAEAEGIETVVSVKSQQKERVIEREDVEGLVVDSRGEL